MTPLGEAIYQILRHRLPLADPRITYAELARQLRGASAAFEHVHHRNRELYTALTEVGQECRRRKLPPLPALVVRADTRRPGAAYYEGVGTDADSRDNQLSAWQKDLKAVKEAKYPPR